MQKVPYTVTRNVTEMVRPPGAVHNTTVLLWAHAVEAKDLANCGRRRPGWGERRHQRLPERLLAQRHQGCESDYQGRVFVEGIKFTTDPDLHDDPIVKENQTRQCLTR